MNTLAQRLKYAKRELTDLKTAHRRGLGLLKIYKTAYNLGSVAGIQQDTFQNAQISVRFSSEYSSYPYAYIMGDSIYLYGSTLLSSSESEKIEYKDNGYSILLSARILYAPSYGLKNIYLFSTIPPSSINFNWV